MNPMTVLNFLMSVALLGYSAYLIFYGRREVRSMMIVFAVAGLWAFGVHLAVVIDLTCCDFMTWQLVTNYLIRPLIFVLMSAVLAAAIKSGWRYDR
jgi:hypothetical protein